MYSGMNLILNSVFLPFSKFLSSLSYVQTSRFSLSLSIISYAQNKMFSINTGETICPLIASKKQSFDRRIVRIINDH